MSIEIDCPGGHTIKVKDKYAGMKGRCPICGEVVQVPKAVAVNTEPTSLENDDDDSVLAHDEQTSVLDSSGVSLVGSSIISRAIMLCPKCDRKVRVPKNKVCPNCGAYFTFWA